MLAAQRPTGITDQMRANIKFRICLRVETTGESREMLRRADAAYLPGNLPGRGYLQVGNDEIELIQVAYSGDVYKRQARNRVTGRRAVWCRSPWGAMPTTTSPSASSNGRGGGRAAGRC